jgi:sortase family protein, putative
MKNAAYLFGILCILAGLLLFVRNLGEDREAGIEASDSLQVLADELREEEKGTQQPFCVDGGKNILGTGKETQQAVLSFYKDMEMPAKRVEGRRYIGILEIGALRLKLPVLDTFSYRNIKVAPARFFGSVYDDNLILLAHNYQSHFGKLHLLQTGDEVSFTDMDGNRFRYTVTGVEVIGGMEREKLAEGDFDLCLFTCTLGGKNRVVVRCRRVEESP